jgi:DNA polymerase I-like protein with 3'-5' exonuclease and polymerase domains
MLALDTAGLTPVLSVHDEVVLEVPYPQERAASSICQDVMCDVPAWGRELPLKIDMWSGERYGKR